MAERNVRTEVAGFLAQGRRRTPNTPSEITGATFPEVQKWLGDVLRVTRQQIAEAFEKYESTGGKRKPHLYRGTWQGRKESVDCAFVRLTGRGGLSDLLYDVLVSTSLGVRTPYVTLHQESLTDITYEGREGRASNHRITGEGVPQDPPRRK